MELLPKKFLGQYFLTSKAAVATITRAAELQKGETVLEIGPGKGFLTEALLHSHVGVIAIEKDAKLFSYVQEKFKTEIDLGRFEPLLGDVRDIDIPTYVPGPYKLVANIPYYITGQILRDFLSMQHQPQRMVLLIQKEVAHRVVASDQKESILSISVKAYGTPRYITTVSRRHFKPQPNVDSAVLLISNVSRDFFNDCDETKFFELVKAGFAHKRKKLLSNLGNLAPKEKLAEVFAQIGLEQDVRAEDVALNQWKRLAQSKPISTFPQW